MQGEEVLKQLNTDILIIKDNIEEQLLLKIADEVGNKKKR